MVDLHFSNGDERNDTRAADGSLEQLRRLAHRDSRQLPALVEALCDVAKFRSRRGAPANSKELYDEAISRRNESPESVGPELFFRIQSLMAYDFDQSGRSYDAIRHYEASLELAKICDKLDPIQVTVIHNNLGMLYADLDNFNEAERNYLLAVEKLEGKSDENDPRVAAVHNNLGVLYFKKHEYERSRAAHNKALRIRRRLHAGDHLHPDLAQSYENLAALHKAMGDTKTARVYRDRVEEARASVISMSTARASRNTSPSQVPAEVNQAG